MKPQQKKKRTNNGYFARNIQQFGPDFLSKKTAKDIKYDFRHVFKDIAFSEPDDIVKITEYFTNSTFVYNLNMCAFNEYTKNNAVFLGLQTFVQYNQMAGTPVDPNMRLDENMLDAQQLAAAYGLISTHLNNILSLFSACADGEQLRIYIDAQLKSLSAQLSKYRRII